MDSRPRLERANTMLHSLIGCGFLVDQVSKYVYVHMHMLHSLIGCGFLVDQEAAYKNSDERARDGWEVAKLTEYKLTSIDHVGPNADLRRLVTKAGLAWLRASAAELESTVKRINGHPRHPDMCKSVIKIFQQHDCADDLRPDGRPRLGRIWKAFYMAQLFASGTHYIIFDQVDYP